MHLADGHTHRRDAGAWSARMPARTNTDTRGTVLAVPHHATSPQAWGNGTGYRAAHAHPGASRKAALLRARAGRTLGHIRDGAPDGHKA